MRTRLLLPVVALAVLLAGCSGDDPAPGRGDAAEEPGDELAACIQDTWTVRTASAEELIVDTMVASGAGMPDEVLVSGSAWLTLTDTTLTWEYEAYTTEIALDLDGTEYHSIVVQDGRATSSYELDGELMTTTALDLSQVTQEGTLYLDGVEQTIPAEQAAQALQQAGSAGAGETLVRCGADALHIVPVLEGRYMHGMGAILTRG